MARDRNVNAIHLCLEFFDIEWIERKHNLFLHTNVCFVLRFLHTSVCVLCNIIERVECKHDLFPLTSVCVCVLCDTHKWRRATFLRVCGGVGRVSRWVFESRKPKPSVNT